MDSRTRLILALMVLVAVFLVGTAGYVVIERASFGDAAYMTATTLSTVGFKEVFPLGTAGRIWTILIIAFGIGTVFTAFGVVTAMIVSGEVGQLLGSRKVQAQIDQLNQHVIVCGFGRMGHLLARELQDRRVSFVVIERDDSRARRRSARGFRLSGSWNPYSNQPLSAPYAWTTDRRPCAFASRQAARICSSSSFFTHLNTGVTSPLSRACFAATTTGPE
jgi:hypothetical protein